MTDEFRYTRGRRISAAMTRALESLWWRGHPVFLYFFSFVSFALLHVYEYMIPVDSDGICSNEMLMYWVSWLIPKVTIDCTIISTKLGIHRYANAAIILDLWIYFSFIISIVIGVLAVVMDIRNYVKTWMNPFEPYGCYRKFVLSIIAISVTILNFWIVSFVSMLIMDSDGRHALMAILWGHGLGAAFHTLAVGIPCVLFGTMSLAINCGRSDVEETKNER